MTRLCPSHITLQGPVRAVPGLFWTKIVSPLTGPVRTPCGAVRILPPRTVPQRFNACIISLRAPCGFMPQSHPTTGPVRFLSPVRFLARKTEWSARRILRRCCSHGHIRLRAPCGLARLYTYGLVEWFAGLHGYPVRPRTGIVRVRNGIFNVFHILRDRTGPARVPYDIHTDT